MSSFGNFTFKRKDPREFNNHELYCMALILFFASAIPGTMLIITLAKALGS